MFRVLRRKLHTALFDLRYGEAITADAKTSLEAHMESLGYVLIRVADDRNLLFARFNEEAVHPPLALGVKLGSALLGRRPPS